MWQKQTKGINDSKASFSYELERILQAPEKDKHPKYMG